jgi:hypothetical protein
LAENGHVDLDDEFQESAEIPAPVNDDPEHQRLEEFQSLRDFGRVIARTDPPSFLLRWSDDVETVFYGDNFCWNWSSY